jgi:hypothetical protein
MGRECIIVPNLFWMRERFSGCGVTGQRERRSIGGAHTRWAPARPAVERTVPFALAAWHAAAT